MSCAHISKRKRCFNVKSPTYYFHVKTKILADFQICISVSLTHGLITSVTAPISDTLQERLGLLSTQIRLSNIKNDLNN